MKHTPDEMASMLRELTATLMLNLEAEGSIHAVTARMAWELAYELSKEQICVG